jgi:hypothetical protein
VKRVLLDRHQADLFYSLQLLFEDRLGYPVYTPVGHDWWDAGYWRFGHGYGDDRLARQFLTIDANWTRPWDGSALWETHDGHHPERVIRGVELPTVLGTMGEWGFVVATVQDNQAGFKRLADEIGATYVLQAGNTRQDIDWSLDPLALVSSEMPIRGRGVRYHQEIDRDVFTFTPLNGEAVIRSFVNCFDSTPCHRVFQEVTDGMAAYVHGIDGADGNIETVSEIADLMRHSGWGWHDKIQGDGFGHVLHNWAAIGRPLIGHSGHYRGLLGEGFWRDGETCIDLDRHTVPETIELIREITGTPRHAEMGRAIREVFERIDYDAEAEQIRALLAREAVAA